MTLESLPGYEANYRIGQDPEIDEAICEVSKMLQYKGGICYLDTYGNVSQNAYTSRVGLEIPNGTPESIIWQVRAKALQIIQLMDLRKKQKVVDLAKMESENVLFEIDGYKIKSFEINDKINSVYFSFKIDGDVVPPTFSRPSQDLLIQNIDGWDFLEKKGWIDREIKMLVPLHVRYKLNDAPGGDYILTIIFTTDKNFAEQINI
ncbi:hypothetical protein KKD70_01820 [Patescibacteria group bacterium]|nr:hypothetical protein [Patescibacteria group bacterium]